MSLGLLVGCITGGVYCGLLAAAGEIVNELSTPPTSTAKPKQIHKARGAEVSMFMGRPLRPEAYGLKARSSLDPKSSSALLLSQMRRLGTRRPDRVPGRGV